MLGGLSSSHTAAQSVADDLLKLLRVVSDPKQSEALVASLKEDLAKINEEKAKLDDARTLHVNDKAETEKQHLQRHNALNQREAALSAKAQEMQAKYESDQAQLSRLAAELSSREAAIKKGETELKRRLARMQELAG